jgi:hypothetical protein
MNINEFYNHPQIKFLPGTYDLEEKSAFVNACDAMIHARSGGETFGLAISEFALENKKIEGPINVSSPEPTDNAGNLHFYIFYSYNNHSRIHPSFWNSPE